MTEISALLESARRTAARQVNSVMTATYWEIGRRIVEHEQGGKERAGYGEEVITSLAVDLIARFGRGFGISQLRMIRQFHLFYRDLKIRQSVIGEFRQEAPDPLPGKIWQTLSAESDTGVQKGQSVIGELNTLYSLASIFPLPWTHYARLLRVRNDQVTFSYKDYADNDKIKQMTLSAVEFIRRFMMHVLPDGFMRMRHYGFLGNKSKKKKLPLIRTLIEQY